MYYNKIGKIPVQEYKIYLNKTFFNCVLTCFPAPVYLDLHDHIIPTVLYHLTFEPLLRWRLSFANFPLLCACKSSLCDIYIKLFLYLFPYLYVIHNASCASVNYFIDFYNYRVQKSPILTGHKLDRTKLAIALYYNQPLFIPCSHDWLSSPLCYSFFVKMISNNQRLW